MSRFRALMLLPLLAVMLLTPALTTAQESTGGMVVVGYVDNLEALNPFVCASPTCYQITTLLFPPIIGLDPASGLYLPGERGALATDWQITPDNRAFTVNLREDLFWSDGEQVTAEDITFGYQVLDEQGLYLYTAYIDTSAFDVAAPDPFTVIFTFDEPDCDAPHTIAQIPVVPAHVFDGDTSAIEGNDFNQNPTVTAGLFRFDSWEDDEVVLLPNPDHPDASPDSRSAGLVFRQMEDEDALADGFLAGDIHLMPNVPQALRPRVRDGGAQVFESSGLDWDYVGLNYLDPDDPARPHRLFGDVRVRRALQHAIDVEALVEVALSGQATRMAAYEIPTSWTTDPDLASIPYDVELAFDLLKEAGWTLGPDGILVDEADEPFRFSLMMSSYNTRREDTAMLIADMLMDVGIEVEIEALDFGEIFDRFDSGDFDAYILGWHTSFPFMPGELVEFFTSEESAENFVLNFVGYSNPEVEALIDEALNVPNCDAGERLSIYHRLQEIIQKDQPYLWLYTINEVMAASANVRGFAPYPHQLWWNADSWWIAE